jgi:adenine phosphoribosyltransferase
MANNEILRNADAILSIDARGFIFGTALSFELSKPIVLARKPGKLPGELITKSYKLEYGSNSLSIQKDSIQNFNSFAIVDDLLATGGSVSCVSEILYEANKLVTGLSVLIELEKLNGRKNFSFKVDSQLII